MADNGLTAKRLRPLARKLRTNQTSAERTLWRALQRKLLETFRFRRQVPLCGFIADFACLEARLVIEVDGATHSTGAELRRDGAREAALRENGHSILRFTNDDIYRNLDGVVETIWMKLCELRPRVEVSEMVIGDQHA
jgi:very-short-patch-repair endonuclease